MRTELVRAPVLDFRYYGPIEGRVVHIDRSASDAFRLTLDRVVLFNIAPTDTPDRVRVSVHGDQSYTAYHPGDTLMTTGHLGPPSGPAEPGGFDFQRHAWFLELGAVGYTRNPVLRLLPATGETDIAIATLRDRISKHVLGAMTEETGGFAVAITTGDRSGIATTTMEDLRAANLAHLLAISGLHMGLLTGFVFLLIRSAMVLWPHIGVQWSTKKIAAATAILIGAVYLLLSGGNVATERAFIMVSVMFLAVILDRRALTLRAVAIAATIVLILRPEALIGPGFQMSFAATTALVFVFGLLRHVDLYRYPKWARGAFSVVVSSGVAGLATVPFAAAHFNQIAHFGLIANVLSVPIMGALVMPSAVVAAILAPLGLESIGFLGMDIGLRWILFVAENTANQPGAVSHVAAPDTRVLPLIALGLLIIVLWQGHLRMAGGIAVAAGFVLWTSSERPALLVANTGGFMGLATPEGRDLSRATGHGFVAKIWLENDGAPVPQRAAAAREGKGLKPRNVCIAQRWASGPSCLSQAKRR
ncbi:ComEC/Rec2 family competence protein [Cognatiyoonia sediminum]|uniref:ComEC/Rec2 family competence protein n=1 Tax=Cognatiyoonia sediminum TaxID=1508389 RepID=UPI001F610190|nr:ComEC/Rec2 family competence protein [Cognatiyoonia sediminum]